VNAKTLAALIRAEHDSQGTDLLTSHKISMRKFARRVSRDLPTAQRADFLTAATGASDPFMSPAEDFVPSGPWSA
jgi:hypothetical protein